MVCIHCSGDTQIINSRLQKRLNSVWRRRRCRVCTSTFTTRETADLEAAWRVRIKIGSLMPFSRDKLMLSLYTSLQHRPSAIGDAGGLSDTIIAKLAASTPNGLLTVEDIAETAAAVLQRFDSPASVHYQAFES